jgi:hypothetical protein
MLAAEFGMAVPFLIVGLAFVAISVGVFFLMPGVMAQALNAAPATDGAECEESIAEV